MTARRFHHCRTCRTETAQTFLGEQNGGSPRVEYWRCVGCGSSYYALADVHDGEGLCLDILRQFPSIPQAERDDVLSELRLSIWSAYAAWDGRGTFLGYGTFKLRLAVIDWIRHELGDARRTPKAHAGALSLDAPVETDDGAEGGRLVEALDAFVVDGQAHSLTSLLGEVSRRDRALAREDARVGVGADEAAA